MTEFKPNITIYELEKDYILKALVHFEGNKTQTARSLGITIKTLYNKLHEYGETKYFIRHKSELVEEFVNKELSWGDLVTLRSKK